MDNSSRIQSLRAEREMRHIRRWQRRKGTLLAIFTGVVLVILLMELGRAFQQMQQVNRFVQTLSLKSPAEVTMELDQIVVMLTDRNPLVRHAGIAAFTAATGLQLDGSSGAWWQWWQDHRATWRYCPTPATNDPGLVSPQPYRSAFPQRR